MLEKMPLPPSCVNTTKPIIVIAVNSLQATQWEAYNNHMQFMYELGRYYPDYEFAWFNTSRMSIDRFRNEAAKFCVENNCKYLLFLDDDVSIPPRSLRRLIEIMEDPTSTCDVVAGNVIIRGWPFDYMLFEWEEDENKQNLKSIKKIGEGTTHNGVETIGAVGFSLCLIKVELLHKLAKPWFVTGPNHTEDIYFCVRTQREHGAIIKVDWDIICNHILWGEMVSHANRDAYRDYYLRMNPGLVDQSLIIVDRSGEDYEKVLAEQLSPPPEVFHGD